MLRGFMMDDMGMRLEGLECSFAFVNKHSKPVTHPFPHTHPCVELIYNGEGRGWVHEGGLKRRYLPNQAIVCPPGVEHWAEDEPESLGYHLCVGVAGALAERLKPGVYSADQSLTMLFKLIEGALGAASSQKYRKERLNMLSALVCMSLLEAGEASEAKTASSSIHAQRAKAIIDARFMENLSLDDLASNVYVSSDHLRAIFKRDYGMAPIHYLLKKRIELAQGLLAEKDRKVAEVAKLCGFSDPYYFSRIFKKISGKSPQEYRESL